MAAMGGITAAPYLKLIELVVAVEYVRAKSPLHVKQGGRVPLIGKVSRWNDRLASLRQLDA